MSMHCTHCAPAECLALPETEENYTQLAIVMDAATNYLITFPVKSPGAEEVARAMVENVFTKIGASKLITDRGSPFMGKVFQEVMHIFQIAHAFAKHGQERMTTGTFQQLGGIGVALATNQKDQRTQEIWSLAYGLGSTVGVLAFSRTHETEADKLGLVFMLMAGYNGEEAAELWVRMSKNNSGKQVPKILRTHPTNEDRIKTLRAYLPEARKLAAQYNSQLN